MCTETLNTPKWITTDSDTRQKGRQLGPGVYEFKERRNGQKFRRTVVLADYSTERQEYYISAYYGSLAKLRAEFPEPEDADWLLAECIFEQLSYYS
jgi:hypothetical protein